MKHFESMFYNAKKLTKKLSTIACLFVLGGCAALEDFVGDGDGMWSGAEIFLLVLTIIVIILLIVVIILIIVALAPEGAIAAVIAGIIKILSVIGGFIGWLVRGFISVVMWLIRLLPRLWRWSKPFRDRLWIWLVEGWTWFKGTTLGGYVLWFWDLVGGNALWDFVKWGIGGALTLLLYLFSGDDDFVVQCPGSVPISKDGDATEREFDGPWGATRDEIMQDALQTATDDATEEAKELLQEQIDMIKCEAGCSPVVGPIQTEIVGTPQGGWNWRLYTVTVKVKASTTVSCVSDNTGE